MAADTFDDRVAMLEEHLVPEETTADYHLARAEHFFAQGIPTAARLQLTIAKDLREEELEEDDDA